MAAFMIGVVSGAVVGRLLFVFWIRPWLHRRWEQEDKEFSERWDRGEIDPEDYE